MVEKPVDRSRREVMRAVVTGVPLGLLLRISRTEASEKMTRQQAEYQDAPKDIYSCGMCTLFEHGRPLPPPTPIERIVLPKGCDFLAYFIVGVDPPDPSERVNVYLPKSLIGQIDRRAAELGMSRSSFFGLAASTALTYFPVHTVVRPEFAEPRSKVHKTGRLRTKTSPAKKSPV